MCPLHLPPAWYWPNDFLLLFIKRHCFKRTPLNLHLFSHCEYLVMYLQLIWPLNSKFIILKRWPLVGLTASSSPWLEETPFVSIWILQERKLPTKDKGGGIMKYEILTNTLHYIKMLWDCVPEIQYFLVCVNEGNEVIFTELAPRVFQSISRNVRKSVVLPPPLPPWTQNWVD